MTAPKAANYAGTQTSFILMLPLGIPSSATMLALAIAAMVAAMLPALRKKREAAFHAT